MNIRDVQRTNGSFVDRWYYTEELFLARAGLFSGAAQFGPGWFFFIGMHRFMRHGRL